ncbi:hypothetical protein GCM10011344_01600 [Dokdonia pacifica]|uniref:Chromosome partitioning protein ParA n=1 Tax=Dokdonia pacifica TaxID=1627892 RepID=A0A238Z7Y8_9FLAO|nr:hypothetical protein [Dokdonia pacifica]GGG04907.1 hypothetical protein GCM10011344_01600 [Dokdonia pacifica]SNR79467.1 hypothetical protein SAMN06265376_10320 [Dokdonia pacifica]
MENEKNNNGIKIITGILAVLLVVAGAFAVKLYNQEKDTKAELTKEKNLVIANLREMNDKYDVVIEENNLKDTELNEARDRIQALIDDINEKEVTITSLSRYRGEVFKLRKERDFLFAQNDSLRGSNRLLAMRVDSTSYELEVQRGVGDSLSLENDKLAERVEIGAALAANKLKAVGVIERSSGKLVENARARRVDKVRACFTVPQNRLAEAGDRVLYVQVVDPSNNILGANERVTFEEETITYSKVSKFYYENTALDICENIPPIGDSFEAGVYKVNVYDQATLIAQTSFTLK